MADNRSIPAGDQASSAPAPARQRRWVAPTLFGIVVLVPALILIFSNLQSTEVDFAWMHWTAPLWIILAASFVAGAVVTRLLLWAWRTARRRRKAQVQTQPE